MVLKHLQCRIEDRETGRRSREVLEAHHRMPDEKLITTVHICARCGRRFPFKRGRKRCPRCRGLLKVKTIVLKIPYF